MNKFKDLKVQLVTNINNIVLYTWKVLRGNAFIYFLFILLRYKWQN